MTVQFLLRFRSIGSFLAWKCSYILSKLIGVLQFRVTCLGCFGALARWNVNMISGFYEDLCLPGRPWPSKIWPKTWDFLVYAWLPASVDGLLSEQATLALQICRETACEGILLVWLCCLTPAGINFVQAVDRMQSILLVLLVSAG